MFDIYPKQIYPQKHGLQTTKSHWNRVTSGNCINSHYVLFLCTLYKEDITI